jgi:hypothetical protein
LLAERTRALQTLDTAVQQMRQYYAALATSFKPDEAVPSYVTVPPDPSLRYSARRRFALDGALFTFMRRQQSRVVADWLLKQLSLGEFASYIQGPQGIGKSHLLYEAVLLLRASGCRVVYEHDCASWAGLAGQPSQATLYFLRSIAIAFVDDAEVLGLCREVTANVAVMSDIADAEHAVCFIFLPRLGDMCKRRKVFFVFDQHNSLTPAMRETFPYSLPESQLLHISQLRDVAMVTISASANNEYYLKVALEQPPWPKVTVTEGFGTTGSPSEMDVFLQHHALFAGASAAEAAQLRYETSCFPLELAYVLQVRKLLQTTNQDDSFQVIVKVYLDGLKQTSVDGRRDYFARLVRHFDVIISGRPDAQRAREHVVNGVICMHLQLPLSSFPGSVLLNLQLCFMSDVPFGEQGATTLHGGLEYIHPIAPSARSAAVDFYLKNADTRAKVDITFRYVFESPLMETGIRGLLLQRYLIDQLQNANSFTLLACEYGSDHSLSEARKVMQTWRLLRKVEWYGNGVPEFTLSRAEDLLLVPLSQTYPGVDFLIWVSHTETLVLFQVTLSSVKQHSSNFWEARQDLQSTWQAKLNVQHFKRVWITPDVDAGAVKHGRNHAGQWACSLARLAKSNGELLPLVRRWLPASAVDDGPDDPAAANELK